MLSLSFETIQNLFLHPGVDGFSTRMGKSAPSGWRSALHPDGDELNAIIYLHQTSTFKDVARLFTNRIKGLIGGDSHFMTIWFLKKYPTFIVKTEKSRIFATVLIIRK